MQLILPPVLLLTQQPIIQLIMLLMQFLLLIAAFTNCTAGATNAQHAADAVSTAVVDNTIADFECVFIGV